MNETETGWVLCPACGGKTRTKARPDTVLENFPLFCPKCRRETLIRLIDQKITVIQEPAALDAEPMKP